MKIIMSASQFYNVGDAVAVEHLNTNEGEEIYVGKVTNVEENKIETTIPLDENRDTWEFLSSKFSDRGNNWINKFKSSNYKSYMKIVSTNSGDIQVSGI